MTTDTALPVVELRQYTLHPGQRDTLITLFDREFVETQDACGMQVMGQFRDLDDADRFVWLRGFASMAARFDALSAFYGGPVWQAHRNAANATMIDSDNVLLLKPAWPGAALPLAGRDRGVQPARLWVAQVCLLNAPADDGLLQWVREQLMPVLETSGASPTGCYATDYSANTFTPLPVREGEHALLWFTPFADAAAHAAQADRLAALPRWRDEIAPALRARLREGTGVQTLRLAPTTRSLL